MNDFYANQFNIQATENGWPRRRRADADHLYNTAGVSFYFISVLCIGSDCFHTVVFLLAYIVNTTVLFSL